MTVKLVYSIVVAIIFALPAIILLSYLSTVIKFASGQFDLNQEINISIADNNTRAAHIVDSLFNTRLLSGRYGNFSEYSVFTTVGVGYEKQFYRTRAGVNLFVQTSEDSGMVTKRIEYVEANIVKGELYDLQVIFGCVGILCCILFVVAFVTLCCCCEDWCQCKRRVGTAGVRKKQTDDGGLMFV